MTTLDLWNRYMRSYDFLKSVQSYRQNINDIVEMLSSLSGSHVLDAGSGTGNLSILLKSKGALVTSCDFSQSAVEIHRTKDPAAEIIVASLEERLPVAAENFDSVCCLSVLFALTQNGCRNAISEFYRVLRPGGTVVITVAAQETRVAKLAELHLKGSIAIHGTLRGILKWLLEFPALANVMYYSSRISSLPDWQGFHRFTEGELSELLTKAGFTTPEISRTYGQAFYLVTARKPDNTLSEITSARDARLTPA